MLRASTSPRITRIEAGEARDLTPKTRLRYGAFDFRATAPATIAQNIHSASVVLPLGVGMRSRIPSRKAIAFKVHLLMHQDGKVSADLPCLIRGIGGRRQCRTSCGLDHQQVSVGADSAPDRLTSADGLRMSGDACGTESAERWGVTPATTGPCRTGGLAPSTMRAPHLRFSQPHKLAVNRTRRRLPLLRGVEAPPRSGMASRERKAHRFGVTGPAAIGGPVSGGTAPGHHLDDKEPGR